MRRWVISSALLANALASGVVLIVLLVRGGWGNAVELSPVVAQIFAVLAAVAFVLTLLLVSVLGIGFWAGDRGTRRLEARLAAPPREPPHDGPTARPRHGRAAGPPVSVSTRDRWPELRASGGAWLQLSVSDRPPRPRAAPLLVQAAANRDLGARQ